MRLYTVQSEEALAFLLQEGFLRGDWSKVEDFMLQPYRWLVKELNLEHPPIWFKSEIETDILKSFSRGKEVLLIEVESPVEDVTSFITTEWESILNSSPISLSEEEFDQQESWSQEQAISSWRGKFFNPNLKRQQSWSYPQYKEYILPYFCLDEVVSIKRYSWDFEPEDYDDD